MLLKLDRILIDENIRKLKEKFPYLEDKKEKEITVPKPKSVYQRLIISVTIPVVPCPSRAYTRDRVTVSMLFLVFKLLPMNKKVLER